MHDGISKALDAGNSLELLAWADEWEEKGKEDHALIVRWMAEWMRRPRREIRGRSRQKAIIQYYWMTKPMPTADTSNWWWTIRGPNEHALPRVGQSMLMRHPTASMAYHEALVYLYVHGFHDLLRIGP